MVFDAPEGGLDRAQSGLELADSVEKVRFPPIQKIALLEKEVLRRT